MAKETTIPKPIFKQQTIQAPKIKKIEMVHGGSNGLKLTFSRVEIRNGVGSVIHTSNEHWERPVQKELRVLFPKLREHLLAVTGYPVTELNKPLLEENITATYVMKKKKGEDSIQFMLGGKNISLGKYTAAVNSALIEDEDYEGFGDLIVIMEDIFEETKKYMRGEKGADSRTVAIDYMIVKKQNLNAEHDFEHMSKEEQDAMIKEGMESFGLTIVEENGENVISTESDQLEEKLLKKETSVKKEKETKPLNDDDVPSFGDDEETELPIDFD